MSARKPGDARLSRRRFVALAAAGSAAIVADPASAAARPRRRPPERPGAADLEAAALHKEFERQRKLVHGALAAIRAYRLPPGGDLPVVFRPLRQPRRAPGR